MNGGCLESCCEGRVYGADGAVHGTIRTVHTTGVVSGLQAKARALVCSPDTTPAYPHLTSNLQQNKNETTNVVINIIVASY